MPAPTSEQLRDALRKHPRPADAFKALGVTKAGVYFKRKDGNYQHPELVAILREHAAAQADNLPRDAQRKVGKHLLALPAETVAGLDARASTWAQTVGPKRATRSAVARQLLEDALQGPLPPPAPGDRAMKVTLDLGPVWGRLAAELGTEDPQAIAGVVRVILAPKKIDTPKKKS